ncbi:hypothetical protein OG693_39225 (plasmid) [Streptomyces sp. NBC_01259]|uniref:hypothetical protein n=1 Tax=Streptomyces sp. NBC_01259 TaxID=2903800 RepID=UPI002F90B13A
MPERIYINRIPGDERIHVEIPRADVADLLADLLPEEDGFQYAATRRLIEILRAADHTFNRPQSGDRP